MRRCSFFLVCFLAISFIPAKAPGQIVVDLTNKRGISAPCVGIGPAAPVALKCAKICEEAGFLRNGDVGYYGLTVATDGAEDGKVTEVAAGSPSAQAGIVAGDARCGQRDPGEADARNDCPLEALRGKGRGHPLQNEARRKCGRAENHASASSAAAECPEGQPAASNSLGHRL